MRVFLCLLPVVTPSGFEYNGDGAAQCNFAYWRDGTSFTIGAKGAATPEVMFYFYYIENAGTVNEGFVTCDITVNADSAAIYDGTCPSIQ